jgi:spoIIIJ-associated protein
MNAREVGVAADLEARMVAFVEAVTNALGLSLEVECTPIEDGTRITVNGDSGEVLLRRKGEGLDALQHIVNAAFRGEHGKGRIVVDCLDYRKGKDEELRQTAVLLAERARRTGATQEIGPLNPYARRIVHLAIADDPDVSSGSVGDAFLKRVLITAASPERRP